MPDQRSTLRSDLVYQSIPENSLVPYIVKFREKPDGVNPVTYFPDGSCIVLLTAEEKQRHSDGSALFSIYQPGHKLLPEVVKILDEIPDEWVCLRVSLFRDAKHDGIELQILNAFKGTVSGQGERLRISVPPETASKAVRFLAFSPKVEYIEACGEPAPSNNDAAWVGQSYSYSVDPIPVWTNGVTGDGEVIAIADTGLDADMCYFHDETEGLPSSSLNPLHRKVISYHYWTTLMNWDEDRHGTHVAGTASGNNLSDSGNVFLSFPAHDHADGMAPGAKLVIQDVGNTSFFNIPDYLYGMFEQAYADGARIHNNSWNDTSTAYTGWSRDIDEFIWNNPDMNIVFSAGNSGPCYSTKGVTSPSTAKNCITVGAAEHGSLDPESIMCWSGNGPADDGRLKPDVAAPGNKVISANTDADINSFNCTSRIMNGTSMAAPAVSGFAALINEYFKKGFYPSGTEIPSDGFSPTAALTKAVIVNSARNMTGAYTKGDGSASYAPSPAMGQGWGRVLLDDALYFSGDSRKLCIMDNTDIAQGESIEFDIPVGSTAEPLEVTLCWSDFPGTPVASPNIVNNLDLSVTVPDSSFYFGNNYSGGVSVTGGSADNLNVVESVRLEAPSPGIYGITINGSAVPAGPQPFALVVTGDIDFSSATVWLDSKCYNCISEINITARDEDLSGSGAYTADIFSTTEATPETVPLTEITAGSGFFRGSILTASGTPSADSILQVSEGDTVTVRIVDAKDSQGNLNVMVESTASADCVSPAISNVAVLEVTETSASISWTTDENASSKSDYGTSAPPSLSVAEAGMVTSHIIVPENLSPCEFYIFSVSSEDPSENLSTDDNSGSWYSFTTKGRLYHLVEHLDSDPEWSKTGDWEFGIPEGRGGLFSGNSDPATAFSGANVYGNDLSGDGDYPENASGFYLETPSVDLTGFYGIHLEFMRFLNVESVSFDETVIEVYENPSWNVVWRNPKEIADSDWALIDIDISNYADNNPDCRVRWKLTSNGSSSFSGWNIDDISIYSLRNCGEGIISLYQPSYACGENIPVTVSDLHLNTDPGIAETVSIEISSTTESVPETVILTEETTDSDIFTGMIPTVSGSPSPDGTLQVTDGDIITATYYDSDDGTGFPASASDTADASCAPLLRYQSHSVDDSLCGADSAANPGETLIIPVTLANDGNAEAQTVSAVLTSLTAGVSVTDGTATFPDIAPAGSGQSVSPHFEIVLSPSVPCGSYMDFNLDISCSAGNYTSSFSIETAGAAPLTDEAGGTGNLLTSEKTVAGNVYSVATSTVIEEIEFYIDVQEAADLVFVVYKGTSLTDDYTRIYQNEVPAQGPGEGFYSSGTVHIPVSSGKYYFIGLTWTSGDINIQYGPSAPKETLFGSLETMKTAPYPPGDILAQDQVGGDYGFLQRITALSQCDVWNSSPDAAFIINSHPLCSGSEVRFTDISTGAPDSWEWDFDSNSVTDSTAANPVYTYSSAGSYTAWLTVSDADGNDSAFRNILINETPLAAFTSDSPALQGQPLSFTDLTAGGTAPYSYNWDFGDGAVSYSQNPVHTYSSAGSYTVILSAEDANGCSGLTSSAVQIVSAPLLRYLSHIVDDSSGNGSGSPDPGESFLLTIVLENTGTVAATSVTADISSPTLGITITAASSAYNDILPGFSQSSLTAYEITADTAIACGTPIEITISISCAQASWQEELTIPFSSDLQEPFMVAIFQDHDPWGFTPNQEVLIDSGITVHFYHSSDMGMVDLNPYRIIISTSQQERRYYEKVAENRDWFEQWIAAGGIFKWIGYTFTTEDYSDLTMPGNWHSVYGFSNALAIADAGHPVFHQPETVVALDLRIASGYIASSPAGALTLAVDTKTNPGQPVTQEWDFGKGKVIVTLQGLEADWSNGRTALHKNFILYDPAEGYCDSVGSPPVSSFMVFSSPQCGNIPVTFTDTSAGLPQDWSWDFDGDGFGDSTLQNPVYTYTAHGTYTAELTVSDGDGQTTFSSQVVIDLPEPSFTTNSPLTVGETALFAGAVSDGTPPYDYLWDFGDGPGNSTLQNPVYGYTAPGTFTVTLSVSDEPGCSSYYSAPFIMTDNPGEVPDGDDIPGTYVTASKSGNDLVLEWGAALNSSGYLIYRGTVVSLASGAYDHTSELTACSGAGGLSFAGTDELLSSVDHYYIIVATGNGFEGDYGDDCNGIQRPSADELGGISCFPQWR